MAAITYSATEDAFMFGEFDTGIPSSAAVRWSTESKPAPVVWMKRMDGIPFEAEGVHIRLGRREQKRLRALCPPRSGRGCRWEAKNAEKGFPEGSYRIP